jgi:class 3 adenylate cyclase
MDLEVQEAVLAKEQVRDLLPSDRRDLPIELKEIRACVDGNERERASEVGQLSQLVMGISNALVDLGMVPI